MMRKALILIALTIGMISAQASAAFAQAQEPPKEPAAADQSKAPEAKAPPDATAKEESSVTEHTIQIGGRGDSVQGHRLDNAAEERQGRACGADVLDGVRAQRREGLQPSGRSRSFITAGRDRHPCGCTWARLGRGAW